MTEDAAQFARLGRREARKIQFGTSVGFGNEWRRRDLIELFGLDNPRRLWRSR